MKGVLRYFIFIAESYLFISACAIVLGLWFPEFFSGFSSYTTLMLQVIFFLSSLKLKTSDLFHTAKQWKSLLAVNAVLLIVLPILVYGIAHYLNLAPTFAIALILLASMPAGMSLPLMVDAIGGHRSFALILTISSSLLAPFTVPLALSLLASTNVDLPLLDMMQRLLFVIVLPFILAQMAHYFLRINIRKIVPVFKPVSLLLLGLLIAASIAMYAETIHGTATDLMTTVGMLFIFFIAIHVFSHLIFFYKPYQEQVTIAASVTFMNFTLAIYLAGLYIPDPRVLLTLVLAIVPWALLLIPFKTVTDQMKTHGWIL